MEERRMNEGVEEKENNSRPARTLRWSAPSPAPGQPFIATMYVYRQHIGIIQYLFSIKEPKKGGANSYLLIHSIPLQPACIGNQTPILPVYPGKNHPT